MSQENVEFVHNAYAMVDRGDSAVWDLLPPDFAFDFSRRLIDPAILRGPDQVRAYYRDMEAAWTDGARLQVEELIDAGDKVLALIRFGGRGKMSGVNVDALVWHVWAFREGLVAGWT